MEEPVVTETVTEPPEPEEQPVEEKPQKIMTPMMKLSQAIKDTDYRMDEVKAHMKNKYGKDASKDLTKEELVELTTDVKNYQIPKEKPTLV